MLNQVMLKCSNVNLGSNIKDTSRARSAGITIEITLSLALAVVSLFLILSLFAGNLSTMATNSGIIKNLFSQNNDLAKTVQTKWTKHPTDTIVTVSDNSQENVQIVADQGLTLDEYIAQAQAAIAKYKATPPANLSETEDLAKAVTIARENNVYTAGSFYTSYGISVNINNNITKVTSGGQTYSLPYDSAAGVGSNANLEIAKYITDTNFS